MSRPISACSAINWLSVPKWLWKGIRSLLHRPLLDRTDSINSCPAAKRKGKKRSLNKTLQDTIFFKKKKRNKEIIIIIKIKKRKNIYRLLKRECWIDVGAGPLVTAALAFLCIASSAALMVFPFTEHFSFALLTDWLTDFCSLFLILSNVRSSWIRFLIVNYDPRLNIYLYGRIIEDEE